MHVNDAAQLRVMWGGKPCDHPGHDDEKDAEFLTGNIVCTQCGWSFPTVSELEADRRLLQDGAS
jgi:hypothetical protein